MHKTDELELVELGSVSGDTQGEGGVEIEGFTLRPKAGLSPE